MIADGQLRDGELAGPREMGSASDDEDVGEGQRVHYMSTREELQPRFDELCAAIDTVMRQHNGRSALLQAAGVCRRWRAVVLHRLINSCAPVLCVGTLRRLVTLGHTSRLVNRLRTIAAMCCFGTAI